MSHAAKRSGLSKAWRCGRCEGAPLNKAAHYKNGDVDVAGPLLGYRLTYCRELPTPAFDSGSWLPCVA